MLEVKIINIHTHIFTYTHVHIHTYIHRYTHIHIHTHTYTYTHTQHTNTYIYTYQYIKNKLANNINTIVRLRFTRSKHMILSCYFKRVKRLYCLNFIRQNIPNIHSFGEEGIFKSTQSYNGFS